jgi:2-amino-4-hydroxy-6-hydroxymethyldihydropteridine diphosphokinase
VTTAYLGLGSNVDAQRNISHALSMLEQRFGKIRLSPIYLSAAVGFDGDDFINLVVALDTDLTAMELRDLLRDMEDRQGRQRDVPKFSDRTLDIDILLFGDSVMDTPSLQLPRPEILKFAHVLRPLADLAPGLAYPGLGLSLGELWEARGDHQARLVEINLAQLTG